MHSPGFDFFGLTNQQPTPIPNPTPVWAPNFPYSGKTFPEACTIFKTPPDGTSLLSGSHALLQLGRPVGSSSSALSLLFAQFSVSFVRFTPPSHPTAAQLSRSFSGAVFYLCFLLLNLSCCLSAFFRWRRRLCFKVCRLPTGAVERPEGGISGRRGGRRRRRRGSCRGGRGRRVERGGRGGFPGEGVGVWSAERWHQRLGKVLWGKLSISTFRYRTSTRCLAFGLGRARSVSTPKRYETCTNRTNSNLHKK